MGLDFDVVPANAEELHDERLTAADLATFNAERKARSVAQRFADAIILGADTLVSLDRKLFGKPADMAEAERMIEELQGNTHEVVTGVCLIHLRQNRAKLFSETTQVTFRKLNRDEINRYLASINPLDKAGAYAIQEGGETIVQSISGSYTNVIGLPTERLETELRNFAPQLA